MGGGRPEVGVEGGGGGGEECHGHIGHGHEGAVAARGCVVVRHGCCTEVRARFAAVYMKSIRGFDSREDVLSVVLEMSQYSRRRRLNGGFS